MENSERPRLFIESIQVVLTGIDINADSERQRLHSVIDEAIDAAVRASLSDGSPPLTLKRSGIRIGLKC